MLDALYRKLSHFVPLVPGDRELLRARARRIERFGPHADIIKEGDEPHLVNVLIEGWACRYKQLEDGRRQIITFFIPGDVCDPCVFLLREMSHTLGTLTSATVARISEPEMTALMRESATLNQALWFDLMANAERQREATVCLGRRTATERLAHLFCELIVRMRVVGLAEGSDCDLPITQGDLGDALGLSTVHINRTLQELRALKLVDLRGRRLIVQDEAALQTLALFDVGYLHLQRDFP